MEPLQPGEDFGKTGARIISVGKDGSLLLDGKGGDRWRQWRVEPGDPRLLAAAQEIAHDPDLSVMEMERYATMLAHDYIARYQEKPCLTKQ